MGRRDFLGVVSGAAVALPLAVRAQQPERVRHIGMLNTLGSDDPEAQARIAVFEQALQQLGWVVGRNLKIEIRQIGGDVDRIRSYAAELVALAPDVILTIGSVRDRATATGHSYYPDRVRERSRSGRCRLRPKHGPPGRQYHWLLEFRVQHERQVGRVAQANRAKRDASFGGS